MRRRHLLSTSLAASAAGMISGPAHALFAPGPDLWERWTRHDPNATSSVDHSPWAAILSRYLTRGPSGITLFDYGAAVPDQADVQNYVDRLSRTRISRYNRPEQFAYWVNLYNALTVNVVLDHYPVSSIRDIDISPGLFSDGPWGAELVEVEGEPISLDDIEHRILRPIWNQDPRIHYAVNCASLGCPNLQPTPFTAQNTEQLLEGGARTFINHPRGATVEDGELEVSSIYSWFKEDFGGSDQGVIEHLSQYADEPKAGRLSRVSRIDDHSYDWSLNDVSAASAS